MRTMTAVMGCLVVLGVMPASAEIKVGDSLQVFLKGAHRNFKLLANDTVTVDQRGPFDGE